jgi:hypothetical protein
MLRDKPVDPEALAATLAQLDVPFLRTQAATKPLRLEPAGLVAALAQHPLPRVRVALIPLFLRHPEFAKHVEKLVSILSPPAEMTLCHFYTAAVYLQRLWQGQLELYLGVFPLLPDYFGQSHWNLPPPTVHYGEAGLLRLLTSSRRTQVIIG